MITILKKLSITVVLSCCFANIGFAQESKETKKISALRDTEYIFRGLRGSVKASGGHLQKNYKVAERVIEISDSAIWYNYRLKWPGGKKVHFNKNGMLTYYIPKSYDLDTKQEAIDSMDVDFTRVVYLDSTQLKKLLNTKVDSMPVGVYNPYLLYPSVKKVIPHDFHTKKAIYFNSYDEYEYKFSQDQVVEEKRTDVTESFENDSLVIDKELKYTAYYEYDEQGRMRTKKINFTEAPSPYYGQRVTFLFTLYNDVHSFRILRSLGMRIEFAYSGDSRLIDSFSIYLSKDEEDELYFQERYEYRTSGSLERRIRHWIEIPNQYIVNEMDEYGSVLREIRYTNPELTDILDQQLYEYEYDAHGNWTKCYMYLMGRKTKEPQAIGFNETIYYEEE